MRATPLAFALVGAAALLAAPDRGAAQQEQQRSGGVHVSGTVTERGTGEPVEGVAVEIRAPGEDVNWTRMTGEEGRFSFPNRPIGSYRIGFERLGYRTVVDSLSLESGSQIQLRVEMTPEAVELEPVVVQTVRRDRLAADGFYRRRRAGLGRFLTRDEIEEENVFQVTDLFRRMPGVRVAPGRGHSDGDLLMRTGCRPTLYVDGVRAVSSGYLDQMLQPGDVEAVEVYQGSQAPARFSGETCGVVAVWTRDPQPVEGERSFWKRLLAAGVFGALAFVLTR